MPISEKEYNELPEKALKTNKEIKKIKKIRVFGIKDQW